MMSQLHLTAFTPEDGWAIVQSGESWFVLAPPYLPRNRHATSELEARRVMADQGVDALLPPRPFEGWGELAHWIDAERTRVAEQLGLELAHAAAASVLGRTTAERAAAHFDEIEQWIGANRGRDAERALHALLQAPAVRGDEKLHQRGLELLSAASSTSRPARPAHSVAALYAVHDETRLRTLVQQVARAGVLDMRELEAA